MRGGHYGHHQDTRFPDGGLTLSMHISSCLRRGLGAQESSPRERERKRETEREGERVDSKSRHLLSALCQELSETFTRMLYNLSTNYCQSHSIDETLMDTEVHSTSEVTQLRNDGAGRMTRATDL